MTAALLVIAGVGLALIYRAVVREVEVSRMKADFVSSVSHEFRTPLAAIDALLERLESGKARDEEMRQRYYRASRQEVHRLTRMVNQLLSLARLDQGREQFARETFELNEPAGEAVQSFVDLGFGARLAACLDSEQEHRRARGSHGHVPVRPQPRGQRPEVLADGRLGDGANRAGGRTSRSSRSRIAAPAFPPRNSRSSSSSSTGAGAHSRAASRARGLAWPT